MNADASLATILYGAAREGGIAALPRPEADARAGASFSEALAEAARALRATVQGGEAAAQAATGGEGDMQALVEALTAAEMAVETAVVMRDRVVEAYQELLRMPV
jgi:flagellar hook-basal body complex protein FliE